MALTAQYAQQSLCNSGECVCPSVSPFVCLSLRLTAVAAGLLLSAPRAKHIDRQWLAPAASSNGAAARRSAANAGS